MRTGQVLYVPKIGMTKIDNSFYLNKYLICWFPFNDMTKNVATDITKGMQAFSETANNFYEDTDRGRFILFGDRMIVNYQDDIMKWFTPSVLLSVCAWIRTTDPTGGGIFEVIGSSGSTDKVYLEYDAFGLTRFRMDFGSGYDIDITGTTDIRDGQWHFLTFIRTGLRTGEIWVDGKLESEDTDNSGTLSGINTPYTTMRFGYSSDGSFMEGNLAHFKIFNYRLTEDQINLLYNDFSAGLIKPNTTRYFLPL